MQLKRRSLQIDNENIACEFLIKDKNTVILHGAGKADKTRYYAFAEELLRSGIGVVLFDFSGHGESTGNLDELSLARRKKQAAQVIDRLLPGQSSFYLLGFSMGAQTLCDLLPIYGSRVEGILLGCPAIYTKEVTDLVFGTDEFTAKLRENASWKRSNAPEALRNFSGHVVIAIGGQDEVIPEGVVSLLKKAAGNPMYKEYPGVSHKLSSWLSENPKELKKLVGNLTNTNR